MTIGRPVFTCFILNMEGSDAGVSSMRQGRYDKEEIAISSVDCNDEMVTCFSVQCDFKAHLDPPRSSLTKSTLCGFVAL